MFAINNSASTLGGEVTPVFIDCSLRAHPPSRLRLSLPNLHNSGESASAYAVRIKELVKEVRALLLAAQQARKEQLDRGRVDTGTVSTGWATRCCFESSSFLMLQRSESSDRNGKAPFASLPSQARKPKPSLTQCAFSAALQ